MSQRPELTSALMPRRGAARPLGEGEAAAPPPEPAAQEAPPARPAAPHPRQALAPEAAPAAAPGLEPPPGRRALQRRGMTSMTVRFDPQQHRVLRHIAFNSDTSIAAIVESLVVDWLKRRRDAGHDAELYPPG